MHFFENPGFHTLNGELARKLGVYVLRESIRRYVLDAANNARIFDQRFNRQACIY